MVGPHQRLTNFGTALSIATLMGFGGCSDGVDMNGKVFDWMGISPAAQAVRKSEPKIVERTPLVLPPAGYVLPPPGSGKAVAEFAWPDDPDQRKLAEGKERDRLHQAYCSGEINWGERALASSRGHAAGGREPPAPTSPYGPCGALVNASSIVGTKKE
jgi:hypothetical protein